MKASILLASISEEPPSGGGIEQCSKSSWSED